MYGFAGVPLCICNSLVYSFFPLISFHHITVTSIFCILVCVCVYLHIFVSVPFFLSCLSCSISLSIFNILPYVYFPFFCISYMSIFPYSCVYLGICLFLCIFFLILVCPNPVFSILLYIIVYSCIFESRESRLLRPILHC